MRVKGGVLLRAEPEKAAVKQNRPPANFLEQTARRPFDGGTMTRKGVDEILLARRCRAEVIFQRLCGDRASHATALDKRGKAQRRIEPAIGRLFERKRYLHDGCLIR